MKKLTFLLLLISATFANETEVLSQTKQDIIELKQQQIKQKEKVNKYEWLSEISINGVVSKDEDNIQSEDYSLSIAQDIFTFGGITSKIEYSKQLKKLETLSLNIDTKDDISSLYNLIIDINLDDIDLKQNELNIKNNKIELIEKKSEYKVGELGISDLNEVLISKNSLYENQKTVLLSKQTNINYLKAYTNKKYDSLKLPQINLPSKELFLQSSNQVKYASLNSTVNKLSYKITKSSYLPALKFNSKYGYANSDKVEGSDYYSYGLSLSVPLNFTSKNDIEQSKLEYLISEKEVGEKRITMQLAYDGVMLNIQSYKEKTNLAHEDIKLYEELLSVNEEEYTAGYKTLDDVETLKNSKQIRQLDIKSYELNIQKELISLYLMLL